MSSSKPRIQALLENDIYEKFKNLCSEQKRSESNMGGIIITNYIENREELITSINNAIERFENEVEQDVLKTYTVMEILALLYSIRDCE